VAGKLIIALTLVAVVILYMTMRKDLETPDPHAVPTPNTIHTLITASGRVCDNVDSLLNLGADDKGWIYYLARCHDGGRYVYSYRSQLGQVGIASCTEEQARGYYCPE